MSLQYFKPIAAAALLIGNCHAASLTVSNITGGPTDVAIVNSSGTPLSSGFAAIFQFNSAPGSVVALQANGDGGLLEQLALAGIYPGGGALSTAFTNLANNPTTAAGGPLFLVFGDGSDVGSSTELAMLSVGVSLDGQDGVSPSFFPDDLGTYRPATENVSIGTVSSGTFDWSGVTGQPSRSLSSIELAVVPEPSAGILSLFGVALLFRRRR